MRFREKLARFMWGRNGVDSLTAALIWFAVILSVINIFLRSFIINMLETAVFIYCIFRIMSRNVYKRRNENMKFLSLWGKLKGFFKLQKNKYRDRKTHIYRMCPECKANLRLPKSKGTHTVKCPRCSHRFEVKN